MKEVLLSDWTLPAFMQREEERLRKEQKEMVVIPTQRETQGGKEPHLGEWTIAALQRRFAAMEQRIAALEKLTGEQCGKDHTEAARVPRSDEIPSKEALLSDSSTFDRHRGIGEQARLEEAKTGGVGVDAASLAREERFKPAEPKILRLETTGAPVAEPIGFCLDETAYMKPPRKKTRGLMSLAITALTAGAVGFGAAIYLVPVQKAMHYRALAKRGFGSIYEGLSTPEK